MNFWTIARWVIRGAEILLAAIAVIILIRLHTAIVEYALTMAGGRTDIPLVLAVRDQCNTTYLVPPAWHSGAEPVRPCGTGGFVQLIATAPANRRFVAFLNDRSEGSISTLSPLVLSGPAQLRRGVNTFTVVDGDTMLVFPIPSLTFAPFLRDSVGAVRSLIPTIWGNIPSAGAPISARVTFQPDIQPIGGTSDEHRYGPYRSPKGSGWLLIQGWPGSDVTTSLDGNTRQGSSVGPDGFVIARVPVRDVSDSQLKDPSELPWYRKLTLKRTKDGIIEASLTACLATDHPLVSWSRSGAIDAPELIVRLTGVYVITRVKANDPAWTRLPRVKVSEPQGARSCALLEAQYSVADGYISQSWSESFLVLPGDELTLDGLSEDLNVMGPPADVETAGHMVWRGTGDPSQRGALGLLPTFRGLRPEMPRALAARTPQGDEFTPRQPPGFMDRLGSLSQAVPNVFQTLLWGFVVAVPVILIYWVLGPYRTHDSLSARVDQARAGILALLAFMTALALHPILLETAREILESTQLRPLIADEASGAGSFSVAFAPIAFVVILIATSLLRRYTPSPARRRTLPLRLIAALFSLLLIAAALAVSTAQHFLIASPDDVVRVLDKSLDAGDALNEIGIPVALAAIVLVWCFFGLLTFWIPVYWLARSVLRFGRVYRAAFVAAALAFFVPLVTPLTEALRIVVGWLTTAQTPFDPLRFGLSAPIGAPLWIVSYVSLLASVVLIVTLVLRGFREMIASMLEPKVTPYFRFWSRTSFLAIIALLIVGPATSALANVEAVNVRVFQVMKTFQAYGSLLAVIAPITILSMMERSRSADGATQFNLDENVVRLLTAIFAGYLALWADNPVVVVVLVAVGWVVFKYGVIGPPSAVAATSGPDLAKKLLAYREEVRLLRSRRTTIEQNFAKATINETELAAARADLDRQLEQAGRTLGMPAAEAKSRLLAFGPRSSPLQNGYLGVVVGLIAACLFQVVFKLNVEIGETHAANWLSLLQASMVDPNYRPVGATSEQSALLEIVGDLLNAVTLWVLIGFLFGFSFHRIRGTDGFVKAIVFMAGITVTFLVAQALSAPASGVPAGNVGRIVPIFLFLLFLGSLVFDGMSVQARGLGLVQLLEIYGLRTSIGYVSFAGLLAGVKPLLELFGLIGKHP